ncbi:MAG: helix-turn-helix domain-containing protein [Chitinophagaceae bacterium]|nr:helix-turn-helix domain-containing protein [Chitinophagaceae bacterium]
MYNEIQSADLTSLSIFQFKNLLRHEIGNYFVNNPICLHSINDSETILDIDEAAAYIKLSVPSIYRLVGENNLPVIKKGKKLLFQKNALTAWLLEGRRMTSNEIKNADTANNISLHKDGLSLNEDEILTVKEAAAFLQVPAACIHTIDTKFKFLSTKTSFPSIRKGEDIFFQKNELALWLMNIGRRELYKQLEESGHIFNPDK